MRANRKIAILLLALILAASQFGCKNEGEAPPELTLSAGVPAKNGKRGKFTAELYFLSDDGQRLSVEERQVEYADSLSHAEAAVRALIDGPKSTVLSPSVPGDMGLQRVETSLDTCNVYLLASYTPDSRVWLTARAAIAATVFACEDISTVNLFLNGTVPGYYGRALGAMAPITSTLDSYIINLQQEYQNISEHSGADAGIYEARTATLYFTDSSGTLLIAKNDTLNYSSTTDETSIAGLLINKLLDGAGSLEAVLPADFALSRQVKSVSLEEWEAGEVLHPTEIIPPIIEYPGITQEEPLIIDILLNKPHEKYNEEVMCGALTLTLTGYLPNVRGVAIRVMDENGGSTLLAENGYFTREDFVDRIGRIVHIAYPSGDGGTIYRVSRAMASGPSYDPGAIMDLMLSGPAAPGVMFPGFESSNVNDVYITGSTVVVDWKAGFSDKLRELIQAGKWDIPKDKSEKMFVYSVVNTLTELEGVDRVWMLEDGKQLGMIDEIYLGNALMRNPGILVEE